MDYENRDEIINFKTILVPVERVPTSAKIKGHTGESQIPLASLRWHAKSDDEWTVVRTDAWNLVRDAIQPRLRELSAEGWQLAKSLERTMTQTKQGSNLNTILILVILGPVTLLLTWLIGIYILVTQGNGDWFEYRSIVIPMRRIAPSTDIAQ